MSKHPVVVIVQIIEWIFSINYDDTYQDTNVELTKVYKDDNIDQTLKQL